MTSPATPAEILSACRAHQVQRPKPLAMWLAWHLLDLPPGRLESEFHVEIEVITGARERLDRAHARGLIGTPAEVWREIVGGAG